MAKILKHFGLYEWSVILFFLIFPFSAVLIENFTLRTAMTAPLFLKWFTFSMVGLRLFSCSIKQISTPTFTAKEIFKIEDKNVLPVVREIGFANLSFGIVGIISFFVSTFRVAAATVGGLYFIFAALGHIFTESRKSSEYFPMLTDIFAFAVLTVLIVLSLL